jgi:preprotein translocase subunit SecA
MSADSDVSTATATMGAPSVEVTSSPAARPQADAAPSRPAAEYREQQRMVAARRETERPATDPLFAKRDVDPNAPCPCGSGKKYKKCHGG